MVMNRLIRSTLSCSLPLPIRPDRPGIIDITLPNLSHRTAAPVRRSRAGTQGRGRAGLWLRSEFEQVLELLAHITKREFALTTRDLFVQLLIGGLIKDLCTPHHTNSAPRPAVWRQRGSVTRRTAFVENAQQTGDITHICRNRPQPHRLEPSATHASKGGWVWRVPSSRLTNDFPLNSSKSSMCSPVPTNRIGALVAATLFARTQHSAQRKHRASTGQAPGDE
jgi:hypothetical protein